MECIMVLHVIKHVTLEFLYFYKIGIIMVTNSSTWEEFMMIFLKNIKPIPGTE